MAVSGHPGLSESCICARPGAKADKKAKGIAEALASAPCHAGGLGVEHQPQALKVRQAFDIPP